MKIKLNENIGILIAIILFLAVSVLIIINH